MSIIRYLVATLIPDDHRLRCAFLSSKEVETFKPMYKLTEVEKSDVDKKYMDIIMSRLKEIKAKYFKENERNWMPDDVQKAWTAEYLELLDKCETEKNELL